MAPPPFPKEHGAWTMVSIPMVLGLFITRASSVAAWLIVPSAYLAFLAHYAVVPWAARAREGKASPPGYATRRIVWGAIYLAGSVAAFAGSMLLAPADARLIVAPIAIVSGTLAAIYAAASIFGSGRSVMAEVLGMIGMALVAPMMAAVAGATASGALLGPAALALSYFLSSVAFVRSYDGVKHGDRRAIAGCVAAHALLLVAVVVVARSGWLPAYGWLAWLPIVTRTAWGIVKPPANLRALGVREAWVAVAFTLLAGLGLLFDGSR